MAEGQPHKGAVLRTVLIIITMLALVSGATLYYFKSRPKPVDKRLTVTKSDIVPPEGVEPFDPKPLMDKVAGRIKGERFRFAVLGDSKHAATLPAFLKYLDETVNPDFVLTTGDMVHAGGGKVGPGYYELLMNEAGKSMRRIPWWPAIGNHEIGGNPVIQNSSEDKQMENNQQTGVVNFKRFYNLDDHYSFEFRNCRFIVLPYVLKSIEENMGWIEAELKKGSEAKQHIFVLNHRPFFTVGSKGASDVPNKETPMTALFQKYGVKAVFSGHDHGYYRTVRSGVPYMISAGGGAKIYAAKRAGEALPEDVYYHQSPNSSSYILHQGVGKPDVVTTEPTQFLIVVDVDGSKITCKAMSVKDEQWDEIELSK